MTKVIDLEKHPKGRERKRREGRMGRRAQGVLESYGCSSCPRRCSFCGMPADHQQAPPPEAPYPLCSSCRLEYEDFRRHEAGLANQEAYWQNAHWAAAWRNWAGWMDSRREYLRSPEFRELVKNNTDQL